MLRRISGALIVVGLCAGGAMGAQQARAASPLVEVRYIGGLCPSGVCGVPYVLYTDGHYTGAHLSGQFRPPALAAVRRAIDHTNFRALRARPFRGVCPIAFDGQEVRYTFYTRQGRQMLDSCREVLTSGPLLSLIDGLARGK